MIAVTKSIRQLNELEQTHSDAVASEEQWTGIWQLFYDSPWFKRRLEFSARSLIQRFGLPLQWKEDIKQEALLVFARSVQRDTSLGFDSTRGSFGAFVSTIIHRCCQKGLRQFNHSNLQVIENENLHPFIDLTETLDEHIDLRECLNQLPEPYRLTVSMICEGKSVPQIASKTRRSTRTVYRWLERAIELLRTEFGMRNPDDWDVNGSSSSIAKELRDVLSN